MPSLNGINVKDAEFTAMQEKATALISKRSFVDNINLVLKKKKKCVISIPTGNSPINFYQSLINLYKEKKISFKIIFRLII